MIFDLSDILAVKAARNHLFPFFWVAIPEPDYKVVRCEIGSVVPFREPELELANAMSAVMRDHGDRMTMWLDVHTRTIPLFVGKALEHNAGVGWGVVITHGRACSHSADAPLAAELQAQVQAINREGGLVWHPLDRRLVEVHPL